MDRLLEICDEMASGSDYVTLKDIVERFYGHKIAKVDGDANYWNLKQKLNRDKDHVPFVEYQNGRDLRGGFRYREGFEYYYRNKEKKNALNRLEGDERQLFLTGGLQMLFDGESSCEHLVELECVSELHNLGLVKKIVNYIQFKRVISFRYQRGYKDIIEVILHPYLLKEYNSRWFLFGNIHKQNGTWLRLRQIGEDHRHRPPEDRRRPHQIRTEHQIAGVLSDIIYENRNRTAQGRL